MPATLLRLLAEADFPAYRALLMPGLGQAIKWHGSYLTEEAMKVVP